MPGLLDDGSPLLRRPRDGDGDGFVLDTTRPTPVGHGQGPSRPPGDSTPASAPGTRAFGDPKAIRDCIYANVLDAARAWKPIQNQRHTLSLESVGYEDPSDYDIAAQKAAILRGETLGRRLRGDWVLRDNATGAEVDRRHTTLATVPYITPRGTFIQGGNEYTLAHQLRLRPGAYTRIKENGELETHNNVSGGMGHRIFLEPATQVFRLTMGQAKMPLVPVLKAMGVSDRQLMQHWGNEIGSSNLRKDDPSVINKLHAKINRGRAEEGQTPAQTVAAAFSRMTLDPDVMKRTLGKPYDRVTPEMLIDVTKKLLSINRGEGEPDDRDHLAYMTLHGPEDLIAERLGRDRMGLRKVLWRASMAGSLRGVPANLFTRSIQSAITSSGLGQPLESINPSQIFEQQGRVSRMGEGGIPSLDAVPDESRNVQPSHFGFIDPLVTPESLRVGVDSRIARNARKGDDGRIYSPFRDAHSGATVWRSPQDVADAVVAFPGELESGRPHVAAMEGGRISFVSRGRVQYQLPHMEDAFSPVTNLVPLKSAVKGQRAVMAGRMITQALPVEDAEAPLVQSGVPGSDNDSYENLYGEHMGALRAQQGGTVLSVSPDEVVLRGSGGGVQRHQLYNNFPYNRKTYIHQSSTVRPGQVVGPGDLLAKSNYTDDQGVTALGKNARVAYVPFRGLNFEDAIVISESFARRMRSQHMYQHALDLDEGITPGLKAHVSIFPGKYDRKTLANFDEDGVVKPGTVISQDHPLILAVKKREIGHNSISRGRKASWDDHSVTWDHPHDGVVTDVAKTPKGIVVSVKTHAETEVGDKLCYSRDMEILTSIGWKPIWEVITSDNVASLRPDGTIEYLNPVAIQEFHHRGPMYSLETTQVSLRVTDNHHLYARMRSGAKTPYRGGYGLVMARDLYGKRYRLKRNGIWLGVSPVRVVLPGIEVPAGQGGAGVRTIPPLHVPVRTYLMLLGMFLSEGNTFDMGQKGRGFDITQVKSSGRARMLKALTDANINYCEHGKGEKVRVYSLQWFLHFQQFGKSWEKFIPSQVFEWAADDLRILYDWLMWGDGASGGTGHTYHTSSARLADDVQRLVLHLGMSANIDIHPPKRGTIKGKEYDFRARYWVSIFRSKNEPEINHGHVKAQRGQREEWVEGDEMVYCMTLPRNHVLYVRRNGKPVWCGNSGRYGDKGIISAIVPDNEMPHSMADGKPFEVLLNPLGIISRCYDEETEFLTQDGWKFGREVLRDELLACYDTAADSVSFQAQMIPMHAAVYQGPMLRYKNKVVDFCVTPGHRMWTRLDYAGAYWQEKLARDLFGRKGYMVPVATGKPVPGADPADFVLPPYERATIKDSHWSDDPIVIDAGDWAEFLGWYVAEGNVTWNAPGREYRTHISQSKDVNPTKHEAIATLLSRLPFSWNYNPDNIQFRVGSKRLAAYLRPLGLAHEKYIPAWVFQQTPGVRQRFLDAYWSGDGSDCPNNAGSLVSSTSTVSRRLADDLQRLGVMQGSCFSIYPIAETRRPNQRHGWRISWSRCRHRCLDRGKWNEVTYDGMIYCPSVPTGYVVTRRNGRILIAGNTNPAQMHEAALGKIAALTGNHYRVQDFQGQDLNQFAIDELTRHGLSDREDLVDPVRGTKIKGVFTGNRFFMKLHHTAESKGQGRGTAGYTMEGRPARGGPEGSKKISLMDVNAILSHGATEVLRDAGAIRGQAHPELWQQYMSGHKMPTPKVPAVYEKFIAMLKGAGINVVRDGTRLNVMALTDRDVDTLAGDRALHNAETVDWKEGLRPVEGGLFDPHLTGGHGGNRWSHIVLSEPMPNPAMEEPIRRILGLTEAKFRDVLAGRGELRGLRGPVAIRQALEQVKVPDAIVAARGEIVSGRKGARDAAVRKLGYLRGVEKTGVHPRDWMMTKVPVLPPIFRPVAVMAGSKLPLVADPNYLYRELHDANRNLAEMRGVVGDLGEERLALYDAFKAVVGLGDPLHPKDQERQVRGILRHVFGTGGPKTGIVQRKLLGSSTDLVGRAVITPNPDLDMDQVGIPEARAWDVYKPFIVRRLVRRGLPHAAAAQHVADRTNTARSALLEEMDERPVILNRAPVLHRYGVMAFRPRLTRGNVLQVSPLVVVGFGADFDGDAMQYHVPASAEAVDDALEKMLPSRNLLAVADYRVHQLPSKEFGGGLYSATTAINPKAPPRVYRTLDDVTRAYRSGEVSVDHPVHVLEP